MYLQLPQCAPRLDPVDHPMLRQHDVLCSMLRLDQMHPLLHGNKWFKLRLNVQYALEHQLPAILSFGGAYSNHLYALAAAGRQFGLRTIGLVRGELVTPLNPVLTFAHQQGMELIALSRTDYRRKTEAEFVASLRQRFGEFYLIPEGGSNALAVAGCAELAGLVHWQSDSPQRYVALACGTGTTLAGLVTGLADYRCEPVPTVLGVAVVKAPGYLHREVQRWLLPDDAAVPAPELAVKWHILEEFHGGGYAKTSAELTNFLDDFGHYSRIPLEPVYTGKLMQGFFAQIEQGLIPAGSEVIALHTGGIYR